MNINEKTNIWFYINKNKEFFVKTISEVEKEVSINSKKIGSELLSILYNEDKICSYIDDNLKLIQEYDECEAIAFSKKVYDELGKSFYIFKTFDFLDLLTNYFSNFEEVLEKIENIKDKEIQYHCVVKMIIKFGENQEYFEKDYTNEELCKMFLEKNKNLTNPLRLME